MGGQIMDRRNFLKAMGLAALSAGVPLGAARPLLAQVLPDQGPPDLVLVKGAPGAATRAAIQALGGMSRFVKTGQKVVIKPNMSFAQSPESATNTHPDVVRELVVLCKEAGAGRVRVLDNPLQSSELALRKSGILDACNSVEEGICRHITSGSLYRETVISDGLDMKSNAFMLDVLEADVIIAVPVAKSHGSTGVSLSLKGQMGLISDRRSMHSTYALDTSIVDLNTTVKPALSVIDATRVLSTKGPGGNGLVLTPGEVIASSDPVAADALAVSSYEWYGQKIAPRQVGHIRLAHERGLGRMDIDNLRISRLVA
ncbi:hypothetical protein FACS1894206_00280 [Deltaproteobacteria bacterium]|nr:hypothetical protein FACS1894206_00280 [Deltaproteobacteria bacterium]